MFNWYILQVYSSFENRVVESIQELVKKRNIEGQIKEILVPTQDVSQVRYGKKVNLKKKFLPGYVLLNMEMTEELYLLIRSLPRVSSFVGGVSNAGLPFAVSQQEVDKLLASVSEKSSSEEQELIHFEVGESLNIISGPFASFTGVIEDIDSEKKKLRLSVSIFGRSTPVELEYHQVEKVESK